MDNGCTTSANQLFEIKYDIFATAIPNVEKIKGRTK